MKNLKKLMTLVLTLAMVLGIVGVQKNAKVFAEGSEGGEVPAAKEANFVVWANGKDDKKAETPIIRKSDSMEYAGPYAGGKWAVVVTTADIDTKSEFLELFKDAETKAKLDTKNDAIVKGKKLATAKLSNGVITVTAGKAEQETNFMVWLYEIRKDGKNTVVVDKTFTVKDASVTVEPVSFTGKVKVANTGIVFSEKDTDKLGKISSGTTKVEITEGVEEVSFYYGDKKVVVSDTATYTVTLDTKTAQYATLATDSAKGVITISATKAKDENKASTVKVIVVNNESGKKATLSITVKPAEKTEESGGGTSGTGEPADSKEPETT